MNAGGRCIYFRENIFEFVVTIPPALVNCTNVICDGNVNEIPPVISMMNLFQILLQYALISIILCGILAYSVVIDGFACPLIAFCRSLITLTLAHIPYLS